MLEWNPPFAKWFSGRHAELSENCLDRHVDHLAEEQGRHHLGRASPARRARSPTRSCCARWAASRTCSRPSACSKGDRVGIYMPMIPEAGVAMLACARIGATHSVVFGGFSAEAVRDRMNDAEAKLIVTADGG